VLSDDEAEPEEYEDEGEDSGEEPPYEAGDSVSNGEAPGGVALTDEELALMLQTEEHHAHMLELAGFGACVACSLPAWTCVKMSKPYRVCSSLRPCSCTWHADAGCVPGRCIGSMAAARRFTNEHRCAGAEGIYAEDELDDEEYYPEDEVDPDNMTYEVCTRLAGSHVAHSSTLAQQTVIARWQWMQVTDT